MQENKYSIKQWAKDDRPREKLLYKGSESLSNSELLAILIHNGTKEKTAVDLAKEIYHKVARLWRQPADSRPIDPGRIGRG